MLRKRLRKLMAILLTSWLMLMSIVISDIGIVQEAQGQEQLELSWSSTETDDTVSIAWADVDNDGDLDLAMGNWNDKNRLYKNDGTGALSLAWNSTETDSTYSIAWGDADNDSDLDLAVGNEGNNRLYKNDGTGALSLAWNSTETDVTYSIAWGDADNDGDLDLAVGNWNGQVNRLYKNDGTGALSLAWNTSETDNTCSIAWGDVDNDGDLDLTGGNWNDENRLYKNDGTGTLSLAWNSTETDNTYSIAWGDVDNDGDLDLAFGNQGKNRLYKNDGTGTLSLAWNTSETDNTCSIAWGDVDNDGDLDLAAGNYGEVNRLYMNDGTGTLSLVWNSTETDSTWSVAWGDADNDGDLDLAVGNSGQVNRIYKNDCANALSLAWNSTEVDFTMSLAWGDVDNDGDLDLAEGNFGNVNRLYKNDGTGVLSLTWNSTESDSTYSIAWGDVDNDGDLDLAVGNVGQANRLYTNDGAGELSLTWNSTETDATQSISWGDVDNDGDLDLAVGNNENSRLYKNDGTGKLWLAWNSTESDGTMSLAWGDVDNDGDLDLAVGNPNNVNRLYKNDGTGTLLLIWNSTETDNTRSVAWGDVDNDGDLDLAAGNWGNENRLYKNDGKGSLSHSWNSTETDDTNSVAWGDLDNDGDLDLAVGNWFDENRLYKNDGTGTLLLAWNSTETDGTFSIALGDADNDGDLDLSVGNDFPSNRLYLNKYIIKYQSLLPNNPSYITISNPTNINSNFFYSTAKILGKHITIKYILYDNESDPCNIIPQYSLSGGGKWFIATQGPGGDGTINLASSPRGIEHLYIWNSSADRVSSHNVVFRIVTCSLPNTTTIVQRHTSATSSRFAVETPYANTPMDPGIYNNTGKVNWTWIPSVGNISNILGYYVCIGTTPGGTDIELDTWTTNIWYEKSGLEDGKTYYCKIKAKNKGGAIGRYSNSSDGIFIDLNGPVANTPVDPGLYNATGIVNWSWTPSTDTGSGILGYYISIGTEPSGSDIVNNTWTNNTWFEKSELEDDMTYYCKIKAKNGAGIIGNYSDNSDGILVDLDVPVAPTPHTTFPSAYNNTGTVNWSWTPTADTGSGIVGYYVYIWVEPDGYVAVNGEFTYNCWYKTSGLLDGKTYYCKIKAENGAGTMSDYSDNSSGIMVDTSVPTSLYILINNGDEYINSTPVILSLNAEDSGSGLYQMAFSTDGVAWTDWESYNTSKSYTLSSIEGSKAVYFRVNDKAGNIAPYVFDSIILDTRPPTVTSIILSDPSPTKAGTVTFTITFSENMSTTINPIVTFSKTSPYDIHNITKSSYFGNTWNGTFTIDTATGDGTNTISVSSAEDLAGNQILLNTSYIFVIDTISPTVTYTLTGTDIEVSETLTITFSEPMNYTSVENSIIIIPDVSILNFSWDSNTLTITFSSDLSYGTEYNVIIGTGSEDLAGNALEELNSWEFTTEAKQEKGFPLLWLIILLIIIVIVVLLAWIIMRRKPEELEEELEETEEEEIPPPPPKKAIIAELLEERELEEVEEEVPPPPEKATIVELSEEEEEEEAEEEVPPPPKKAKRRKKLSEEELDRLDLPEPDEEF